MRFLPHSSAWLALALPLAVCPPAGGVAGPWVENTEARARLIGDATGLGLEFELQPGWHVYWKNSGDAGYPPRIDFARTPALAGAVLLFPAPQRYDLPGGLVSFGYEKQVIYPLAPIPLITPIPPTPPIPPIPPNAARPATGGDEKPPVVLARLDYLVCRTECIPHTAELSLDLGATGEAPGAEAAATAARLAAAREALPRDPASVAGAPQVSVRAEPGPASSLVLVFQATGGTLRAGATDLFFEVHPFFALERPELSLADDGLVFRVPFRPLDETRPMPATTSFAWTLTGLERTLSNTDSARRDGSDGGEPFEVALAGSASVAIPHLRTSDTLPTAGLRPGLVLPLLVAGVFLLLFALHRFRHRRS